MCEIDDFRRIFFEDGGHGFRSGIAAKCALAGDHFVKHRSKGKDVSARIDRHAAHLLGRHVACGSHHGAGFGRRTGDGCSRSVGCGWSLFGESEVEDFYAAFFGDENIFRLQVAVNDTFFVRGG